MMTTGNQSSSIGTRIVRATVAVGIAHLLFKLVGLAQAIVLGRCLAANVFEPVYAFAFENCIFAVFLLGEEVIGPSFLPIFMREMDTRGEHAGWQFANVILTLHFIVLCIVVLLIMLFPDIVIHTFTKWNLADNAHQYGLARNSLVLLAPALICLSLGSTTYMLLNGYKRFFLAAFGDATWKLCVLVSAVVGIGMFGFGYRALIFGLLAGSVAKLTTHLAGLGRKMKLFRPSLTLRNPAVTAMFLLMLPLIGGIVFAKVRDIHNNVTVLSGLNTLGLIKANFFGRKLYTSIGWLVPYAISIAIFPFFCELVDKDDKEKLGSILSQSGRMLLSIFVPATLVFVVLSRPACFLLAGGEFTFQEAEWTAVSMACYILVLPAYSLEYLLMQAFFAHRRMVAVTLTGIGFSALSVAISYVGIVVCGARGVNALAAIALGFTLSRTLKSIVLVFLLKKNVSFFPFRETASFLVRALLVGIVAALFCAICRAGFENHFAWQENKLVLLAELAVCGFAALTGFLVAIRVFRIREPAQVLNWTLARIRNKFAQSRRPNC